MRADEDWPTEPQPEEVEEEGVDHTDDALLDAVCKRVIVECPECEHCGGPVTRPCYYLDTHRNGQCKMHGRITQARNVIHTLTSECSDVWLPQIELDFLQNHKSLLQFAKHRGDESDGKEIRKPEE